MKIGLVGSGGREHALAKALVGFPGRDTLFVLAGHSNPGIGRLSEHLQVGRLSDVSSAVDFFAFHGVDYVVIGPEAPLMAGLVDALRLAGIPAVGPTQSQARIEGDKSFMRNLLRERVGWGSPRWRLVEERAEAGTFIAEVGEVAIKPLGLTGGKGVRVMGVHVMTVDEALDEVDAWLRKDGRVLLEERLVGEEFSRMACVAGGQVLFMPVCQDFKYAYDGDTGGMTGGMGAYTNADGSMPFLRPDDLSEADRLIGEVAAALAEETGQAYRGFLYGQFMAVGDGVRVIEFNARLGDPEAINVMALLRNDAARLMQQIALGELDPFQGAFASLASVCKYLTPEGYPEDTAPIAFALDEAQVEAAGFWLLLASVEQKGVVWQTLGSRTLALAGLGETPGEVCERMEHLLDEIEPPGLRHRRDVGDAGVIQRQVERMARLRPGG